VRDTIEPILDWNIQRRGGPHCARCYSPQRVADAGGGVRAERAANNLKCGEE